MKIFAAYNNDLEIRRQSSSGGFFSVLAEYVIKGEGIVYGAVFDDDWNVVHRRVENINALSSLRSSKYVFSKVDNTYSEAIEDLEAGRFVLFSGTPCQIAAMKKRAGDNPRLLLVEVVCHGAPQPEYWSRYLTEFCQRHCKAKDDIESVNFRDKNTGWRNYSFSVQFKDGTTFTQPHDDNAYMRGFLKNYTLRQPCFRCPFKYPNGSKADITLGDFWGIDKVAPELDNDKGMSIVIARTNIGKDILKNLSNPLYVEYDKVVEYNPAIEHAPVVPKDYDKFSNEAKISKCLVKVINKYAPIPFRVRFSRFLRRFVKLPMY